MIMSAARKPVRTHVRRRFWSWRTFRTVWARTVIARCLQSSEMLGYRRIRAVQEFVFRLAWAPSRRGTGACRIARNNDGSGWVAEPKTES